MPSPLCSSVQNFALGKGDEEVITTLQSFAKTVGEVSPMFSVLLLCLCVCLCVRLLLLQKRAMMLNC